MAGMIFITSERRLPLSSLQFDFVVHHLREAFLPADQAVREQVFRPLDEGGMDIISADELSVLDYRVFVTVVERAFMRAASTAGFDAREKVWNVLCEMVRNDERLIG
ncbi:hypothetical protein [Burkholderia sp. S-53]|uniref:hypothetical protein n=1 Tax=Burkholderia sp. S-53 TaxID=2906514 RepID=UPI0021D1559C|nr:hypothetical protein [Burkholderia sp. S-53]UXU89088.1 hypothetical protein LXM88_11695 [Burkholderia sp. S-53]